MKYDGGNSDFGCVMLLFIIGCGIVITILAAGLGVTP